MTRENIQEYAARLYRGVEPTLILDELRSEATWMFPDDLEQAGRAYTRLLEQLVVERESLKGVGV